MNTKICRQEMSRVFNQLCLNEEMLPIYIYIYIYIYMKVNNWNESDGMEKIEKHYLFDHQLPITPILLGT